MCGIFGYIGERNLSDVLLTGLRRLEYRGYDSAGIAYVENAKLKVFKKKGKISNLSEIITPVAPKSLAGIAHTRWATHGAPDTVNAHPHTNTEGTLAVVHNGIIENYRGLKQMLISEGVVFKSETDTEVIAHLISKNNDGDLEKAVRKTLLQLEGTYGIAVVSVKEPDRIVAARKGSPLIIGLGQNEMILSSDAAAIVPYTKEVIYLEDGEIVSLYRDHYHISTQTSEVNDRAVTSIQFDVGMIEKKGFAHFMLKEIFEQTETITNTYRGRILLEEGNVKLGGLNLSLAEAKGIKRILIVACGTSWHAALVGEYLLENLAGIPVEVDYASEFTSRNCIIEEGTLFLVISQSGETADTLSALREAKSKGARCWGLVNVVGSTIARETNGGIYLHAGPEIGVASTKAFTSQVVALILLTIFFGRIRMMSQEQGREILEELMKLPAAIQNILDRADTLKEIAVRDLKSNNALYLGRGYNFHMAM